MTNRIVDTIREHHLTLDGTADQGNYGMAPYVGFNGSTNYAYRAAGALRGLNGFTAGGWFQATSNDMLMGVWLPAANQCWRLFVNSSAPTLYVSSTGANSFTVAAANITAGKWYFIVGRYTPSTEISIFLNGTKTTNVTSIPAALFNASANFSIGGGSAGADKLTGKASMVFMSHEPIPDDLILVLFHLSRSVYDT